MGKTVKSMIDYTVDESIDHLLKLKVVKNILGEININDNQRSELARFFLERPYAKCHDQIFTNIAYFLKYNLTEFSKRLEKLRSLPRNSREWFSVQMGPVGESIFHKKYISNTNLKNKIPSTRSSKAALAFFRSIDQLLESHHIRVNSDYEDCESKKHEFRIRDSNNKWFCYDYTIKELKLIIEYHGEHCHPRSLNSDWRHLFTNETADIVAAKDLYKKQIAENKGFDYHIIWHGDSLLTKNTELIKIFNNFQIVVPLSTPKRYRKFELTTPTGEVIPISNLKDITKQFGISEHYILQMKEQRLESHNGFKLRKVSK